MKILSLKLAVPLLLFSSTILFSCEDRSHGNGAVIPDTNKDDYKEMNGKGDDAKDQTKVNTHEKDDTTHLDQMHQQGHSPHR
jgi:hypothetical protein